MSPILPPKQQPELKGSSVYLPDAMWERLSEIADLSKTEAGPKVKGYSRNEVIIHFLQWAIEEWERERRAKKK